MRASDATRRSCRTRWRGNEHLNNWETVNDVAPMAGSAHVDCRMRSRIYRVPSGTSRCSERKGHSTVEARFHAVSHDLRGPGPSLNLDPEIQVLWTVPVIAQWGSSGFSGVWGEGTSDGE